MHSQLCRLSFVLASGLTLVACSGGGSSGGGGGGGAPVPGPTVTSLNAVLQAAGVPVAPAPAQIAASFVGGTPTGAPAAAPLGALPLAAADPTFQFSEAELRHNGASGFRVAMNEPVEGGPEQSAAVVISDWAPINELASGARIGIGTDGRMNGFPATFYDRPAGSDLEAIALDGTATVDLSHMGFAYWAMTDFHPDDTAQFIGMAGAAIGTTSPALTEIAGLPATAVYSGTTVGGVYERATDSMTLMAGDIRLNANFGTGNMSARISDVRLFDGESVFPIGPGETIDFAGIKIDSASASFAGSTDDTMSVSFSGEALNGSAAMAGNFFGPDATEAGGTWGIEEIDTDGGVLNYSGSFGAAR